MRRFTETSKWSDPWYQQLSIPMKCLWIYLCDNCDNAGFWNVNRPMAEFCIGTAINWDRALVDLNGRIRIVRSDIWWVIPFVKFQYGKLSRECKPHQQVFRLLEKYNLEPQNSPPAPPPPPSDPLAQPGTPAELTTNEHSKATATAVTRSTAAARGEGSGAADSPAIDDLGEKASTTGKHRKTDCGASGGVLEASGQTNRKNRIVDPVEIPPELDTPEWRAAFGQWQNYKREKGQAYKSAGLRAFLSHHAKFGAAASVAAIRIAMASNYAGCFPERCTGAAGGNGAGETRKQAIERVDNLDLSVDGDYWRKK